MRAAELCMHTAPWVVPVSRPPIAGGGVAVAAGRIVAVDEAEALSQRFPGILVEDHPDCALTPALVNAHTHLELSHLAGLTGVYYSLAYSGFLLPSLLAAALPVLDYPSSLLIVALICVACAALVARESIGGAATAAAQDA